MLPLPVLILSPSIYLVTYLSLRALYIYITIYALLYSYRCKSHKKSARRIQILLLYHAYIGRAIQQAKSRNRRQQ